MRLLPIYFVPLCSVPWENSFKCVASKNDFLNIRLTKLLTMRPATFASLCPCLRVLLKIEASHKLIYPNMLAIQIYVCLQCLQKNGVPVRISQFMLMHAGSSRKLIMHHLTEDFAFVLTLIQGRFCCGLIFAWVAFLQICLSPRI